MTGKAWRRSWKLDRDRSWLAENIFLWPSNGPRSPKWPPIFLNFHEPTEDEVFARENLLPSVNYNSATTYKVIKTPSDFELPKNVGILAYNKIGRDYMKKHLL
jgi:hypothetical protein